jgi:hypothetical protein
MILIFHPKNSSINPADEPVADDKVSTSQSQTLVLGSNITEDYQSYSKSSRYKAPSTVSTFTDNSNYQFGPLPPAPPPDLNQYGLPTGPVVPASDTRSRRMSKASQHIEVVVKKDDMPLYPKKINYEGYVPPSLPYDASSSTASSRKNSKGRSILTLPCHDDIGEFGDLGQLEQTSEVSLDQRLLLKTEDETSYHSQFSIASSMNEQSNDH